MKYKYDFQYFLDYLLSFIYRNFSDAIKKEKVNKIDQVLKHLNLDSKRLVKIVDNFFSNSIDFNLFIN